MVRKINGREITPPNHKSQHQNGGEDEINVGGLSGRLADAQNADTIGGKLVVTAGIAPNQILQYDGEKFVAGDKAGASGAGDIAVDALWVAKGDLAAAAGSMSAQRVAVGTDPWMLLHPNPARGQGLEWRPQVPRLLNRVVRCQDGAATPNNLEIHMAYIPFFLSAGFSQANLNGITCGGFWIDRFQACQPLASNVSRGGLTANNPGQGVGAASMPHVIPWTDIDWSHAVTAIENRNGAANQSNDGEPTACTVYASATNAKAEMLVASVDHLIGRHIEIVQDGVTYFRRIVKQGIADEAKYIQIYPPLPMDITTSDTYVIKGFHLTTPYERFSLAAWAKKFLHQYGLPSPKGNNDWGKDVGDVRAVENEGLADPIRYGYNNHEKSRCLTGSGPLTWSLTREEGGIWDLSGNVWEWDLQKVAADGTTILIAPGYPGAGIAIKPTGSSGQRIVTLYDADVPAATGLCLNSEINIPTTLSAGGVAEYDYDGCWFNAAANTYAALRGGHWYDGSNAGLFALNLYHVPTSTRSDIGFRGAF